MKRSLQGRLSIGLSIAIVCMGLFAGLASFFLALNEAQDYQDASLQQIAALVPPQIWRNTYRYGRQPVDADSDVRIVVEPLCLVNCKGVDIPLKLPPQLSSGFHTLAVDGQEWRVFVRRQGPGEALAVAQSTDLRSDAAIASARRTLLPLLFLVPLLIVFSHVIVRRSLAPIQSLAQVMDRQNADRPEPLSLEQVPEEIAPFLQAINRLLERIRILLEQERRFIADAAHELRTPLTALSLQVQNLERADSLSECRKRVLPLQSGLERSRHLLDQLLGLARQQTAPSSFEPVDLAVIARQTVEDLYPLAEQKKIDFGLDASTALWVQGSAAAFYSLLRNAADNALRYSPENSEVTVRAYREGEYALLEVIDSGPGIPAEESERIFDPFYRIPGITGDGSGLGLTIVRAIAEQLGGQIILRSRREQSGLHFIYRQKIV
ncbi:two-component sensor histidine kinase [Acidithiobacillus sp. 'AMD consortium']|jgi:two-component system OmpR family sensor kinase/two-component system sensor histidine kinase QseC|uniref:histidine kinase n=2 Tax=Acidithiobacillus ferridurans TaxID=1232575 RepID=A0A2Z6IGL8_ACIFI|nr:MULTISPECIES: ATP-binding protein [Acidithiobacillus]MBU2715230.1 two-component sensor histidine kinase [Acidithiobacillus ferridurans]MBU2720538.1 two-component sensor histidine kinase [Acidithiobacillus ferridurans]MBU2724129.1 two-component sensor histidine kinase [Acidithiobacillus ferridurans]MBU2726260.1 two-component sensor histidine kinase [Acidithiobacillus ferridurans]QFG78706.1 two-component sensor histidine kinase [Acidithiobacillus sp. 'AMD consortium']